MSRKPTKTRERIANLLPKSLRRTILRATRRPPVGRVDLGSFGGLEPVSRRWGGDRGRPVDRHYIHAFFAERAGDVRGRVLEVGGDALTRAFGAGSVTSTDVLFVEPAPGATLVADLVDAPQIASESFDCVICTQTLQFIADVDAAVHTLHRILAPGGVLLTTVPTLSRVAVDDPHIVADHWRFTRAGLRHLLEGPFGAGAVEVTGFGNLLSAVSFLHGLAAEEIGPEQLDVFDPMYEVLVGGRAVKTRP